MEIDLARGEVPSEPDRARVCIIGAGIAGLTLAHALVGQGVEVILLEAGGPAVEESSQALVAEAQLAGRKHAGTHEGRFRTFGGASVAWGGQLLPMPAAPGAGWPIDPALLKPFYRAAEKLLGVDDFPYDGAAFLDRVGAKGTEPLGVDAGLNVRLSKWAPFEKRNLGRTVGEEVRKSSHARVYLHAQATELLLNAAGDRVASVRVRTAGGASLRFEADWFAVAAGTVETSRLLLASRSVMAAGVGNERDQVGRNFHDHLTVPCARVLGKARAELLQRFRPWVLGGGWASGATVHSYKLEASAALRERLELNPVLAHFTLEEPADSGLALVREVLGTRQGGGGMGAMGSHWKQVPSAVAEGWRLWWEAKRRRRRFVAAQTEMALRLNVAQDARSASRITLGEDVDAFGMPQAVVDWRISSGEEGTLRRFAGHMREQLSGFEGMVWEEALFATGGVLEGVEDARHAMGGACMGVDPASSVVDAELAVHGVANLFVAGAAVFPEGSPALITLPLMALTLRLGDKLGQEAGTH